jgi:hypothetical protein
MKHINEATIEAAEFAIKQRQAGTPLSLVDLLSLGDDEPDVSLPVLFVLVLGTAPNIVFPEMVASDDLALQEAMKIAGEVAGFDPKIVTY